MKPLSLVDVSYFASLVGAAAGVLTLVATAVIAIYAHRLTKNLVEDAIRREQLTRLREQRKDVRDALGAFDEAFRAWMKETPHRASEYEPVHRRGQSLLATIEAVNTDTTLLAPALDVMQGHSLWISDRPSTIRWLNTPSDTTSDEAEWVAGVVNGALDVTKGGVLRSTATVNDGALLDDSFWEEPAIVDPDLPVEITPHASEAVHLAAQNRWMPKDAAAEASHRLRALIRYKVNLEHALAFTRLANFSNDLQNAPQEERFMAAVQMVMAQLHDEVEQHTTKVIGALNKQLEDKLGMTPRHSPPALLTSATDVVS